MSIGLEHLKTSAYCNNNEHPRVLIYHSSNLITPQKTNTGQEVAPEIICQILDQEIRKYQLRDIDASGQTVQGTPAGEKLKALSFKGERKNHIYPRCGGNMHF